MAIPRCSAVVKRNHAGYIMTVLAIFPTSEEAREWAENANEWYGPEHPLTPLTVVDDVLSSPRKFPVEVMR
jgi:hypothetical protein